jgi:hypothetical protein
VESCAACRGTLLVTCSSLVLTLREGAGVGHGSTTKREAIYILKKGAGHILKWGQDLEILKKTGILYSILEYETLLLRWGQYCP